MPRCRKILGNGNRCKAKAISGSRYCVFHTKRKPPYNGGKGRKQKRSSGSDSTMKNIAERRAIVMAHQVTGQIATAAGTAMLASAAAPVKSRTYTMKKASEVRRTGGTVNKKTTVYRPESERHKIQRRHLRRYHGDKPTRGPKKGRILYGDELRYYGKQQRRAKVGAGLVAYGRSSKTIGYAHAYKPTLRYSPYDVVTMTPAEIAEERKNLKQGLGRMKSSPGRAARFVGTLGAGYVLGGGVDGMKAATTLEVLKLLRG